MTKVKRAVLSTLTYADIFNYPLTRQELHSWLIWPDPSPPASIKPALSSIPKTNNYYHLPNRQSLIKLRRQRAGFSRQKRQIAVRTASFLKHIPFINLIAITGALAMNNSSQSSDIDLMIVTQTNRLWLTRLLSLISLFPHLRRRSQINNRLCLNLWLDETSLALPKNQRNLYTAHEVCQLKPVFNRRQTYQKFITANLWVKHYLPNWKT